MRRAPSMDWDAIAMAGDAGAVPELRPTVAPPLRLRRPKLLTVLLFIAWLEWELGGIARVATMAPPIFKSMWAMAS